MKMSKYLKGIVDKLLVIMTLALAAFLAALIDERPATTVPIVRVDPSTYAPPRTIVTYVTNIVTVKDSAPVEERTDKQQTANPVAAAVHATAQESKPGVERTNQTQRPPELVAAIDPYLDPCSSLRNGESKPAQFAPLETTILFGVRTKPLTVDILQGTPISDWPVLRRRGNQ
jgi:hypothetical protein